MSRIAKKPIEIPAKTEVSYNNFTVTVKGPLGELKRVLRPEIEVKVEGNMLTLTPIRQSLDVLALWGTYASHIRNMMAGVNKVYEKKLIVEGIGFKADVKGAELVMALGFSHPVKVAIPAGLKVTSEKNIIAVSGIDVEKVGQFVAEVRSLKKPEPYKGKGIRYETEVIRRKQGKKSV
ncbi:MAG: ribosomal protein large subunit ribosomal protein [Candidatus Taylorbacteria bacterium]|nr:ribosomal protein large subunit ribosomal protein [Candidatus Taylorbacteria bacterium]